MLTCLLPPGLNWKSYVSSFQCTMAWHGTGWQRWYRSYRYLSQNLMEVLLFEDVNFPWLDDITLKCDCAPAWVLKWQIWCRVYASYQLRLFQRWFVGLEKPILKQSRERLLTRYIIFVITLLWVCMAHTASEISFLCSEPTYWKQEGAPSSLVRLKGVMININIITWRIDGNLLILMLICCRQSAPEQSKWGHGAW